MNSLKAGFARLNANPMLGIGIDGYYKARKAEGILDDLEINALALFAGDKKVIILAVDCCLIPTDACDILRANVSKTVGIPKEAVYLASTHTHTAPFIASNSEDELIKEYFDFINRRITDASVLAMEDLKPAKMGYGIGQAPNIAFVRRFRMKDGSVQTNPGVNNPDIVHPIGDVDERVTVLRFDREGAETLVLTQFADHPDTVGGNLISADWCGFVRRTVEKTIDNTKCIFVNGAQGDVNHVNVHPTGGYLNDMFMDFDDVARGYKHAEYMGRVVTGGVLQAYDKVKYVDVDYIAYLDKAIDIPSNMPTPEQLAEAIKINDLHEAGKDSELPYTGMMLTTVVAEAARMVNLKNGPESFKMSVSGLVLGDIAFVGLPGEPFTGIGRDLKETEGFELVIPTCITNGYEGYFPMKEAYDEGGYESRSSRYKVGVAELLIEESKKVLNIIKK